MAWQGVNGQWSMALVENHTPSLVLFHLMYTTELEQSILRTCTRGREGMI